MEIEPTRDNLNLSVLDQSASVSSTVSSVMG